MIITIYLESIRQVDMDRHQGQAVSTLAAQQKIVVSSLSKYR